MLTGKTIVLAVSGSIAAYKIPNLARMLKKEGADVQVLMTRNAAQFITPVTFESLTGNKCLIDTFDRNFKYSLEHVALAKRADVVMIAPASANVIGKIACGIADDMLTTTVMACPCKKIVSPAMNHNMYHNPIVQDNLSRLSSFGYEILSPGRGMLANGDEGDGRMPDEAVLFQHILKETAFEKDLSGKKIGTQRGTTGYIYCSDDFGDDAVVAYDSGLTAVQALNNGQVDAVVIDNAPATEYVAANPGLKVLDTSYAEEDYAIGMAKGSALEDAVNKALEELKADGTLQAIVDKYINAN